MHLHLNCAQLHDLELYAIQYEIGEFLLASSPQGRKVKAQGRNRSRRPKKLENCGDKKNGIPNKSSCEEIDPFELIEFYFFSGLPMASLRQALEWCQQAKKR